MASQDRITSAPKRQKINNQNVYDTMHIYLMVNDAWSCYKIGVSGAIELRVQKHEGNGFRLIDCKKTPYSKDIEVKILRFIKGSGFQTGPDLFENKFDGWTECWHRDDLSPKSIDELIELSDKFEAYMEKEKEKKRATELKENRFNGNAGLRYSDFDGEEFFNAAREANLLVKGL